MALRGEGNPRRIARIKRTSRSGKRYRAPATAESPDQGVEQCPGAALETTRGPDARQFAHEEAQIRATDVDEHTLEHVGVSAQMHAAQSPGFVEMGVGTLEPFTALAQQVLPASAPNAPPVGVDGRPRRRLSPPATPPAVRLRQVTADSQLGQRHQGLVAVISRIADHLGEAGPAGRTASTCSAAVINVSTIVFVSPASASCTVTPTTALVSRSTACSALCARRVRPSFMRVIVASGSCGCVQSSLEPFFGRLRSKRASSARVGVAMPDASANPAQERLVALARVPAHDAPQRRVGFQRRRVDAHRLASRQTGVGQPLPYPCEDRQVRLGVDPSPRARHRRMVRRRLVQRDVQELPQAQRIGGSPRHRPLPVQALEIAEQQHPDVAARRQTRPAHPVGVERRALLLDEGIEAGVVEHTIQSLVERVARTPRQVRTGHPHRRLPRATPAFAHGHGQKCSTRDRSCRSLSATFTTVFHPAGPDPRMDETWDTV